MKTILEVRRQKLLRELTRVNQQITRTQQRLASIEARIRSDRPTTGQSRLNHLYQSAPKGRDQAP